MVLSQYEKLEMMNKFEEQDFRSVHGRWMVEIWGLNQDGIGSLCCKIFITEIKEKEQR
jgi:hypothetical protein